MTRPADPRPDPVRLGLVGRGDWGGKIAATLKTIPGVELAFVAGRGDWREKIAENVSGVIIAAPPASHAEIALAALARGRAVFIEKPLALKDGDARAILAAAKKAGVPAMVNHVHLFHPAYAELKRQLAAEGPVHMVRGRGGRMGPFRKGVSVLWDWGPHDAAYALDLLGPEPGAVTAAVRARKKTPRETGEIVALSLDYGDDGRAELEFGNIFEKPVRELIVQCADCDLVLDEKSKTPLLRLPRRETESCLAEENAAEGRAKVIPAGTERPLTVALETFAGLIRARSRDISSLVLGAAVTKVLARAEASLKTGKPA
ncbi:MAG: Gfo/Idh/MocA family oxidoreductase [Alphaproteobacteria bacterium]|nr:Gfo/Idh/MocA family oxidoreductase [Alphaproteobacteria bacterium]